MLLTHNLSTIELGSISWRQVINQNFVYLDNNRIFVVNTTAELPTSNFKANRFFYNAEEKNIYFDNGTALVKLAGGAEIDLVNNPNKFLKINSSGTALEYVTINSLTNNTNLVKSIAIIGDNQSAYSVNVGYDSNIVNSNYSTAYGYGNFVTSNFGYNHVFGYNNQINNYYSNYNIVLGSNNVNNSGSRCIKIGDSITNTRDDNICIGSYITNNKEGTINISPFGLDVLNSYSINTRVGTVQNSRVHMRKTSLNTNVLTDVYFTGTESINLIDYSVANIEFKVTMLNESNYTDTCVINGEVVVVQNGSSVIVKHIDKKTVFKDSVFNGADIDFVAGYPRNVLFYVNTNGVTCKMVAKFDITYC